MQAARRSLLVFAVTAVLAAPGAALAATSLPPPGKPADTVALVAGKPITLSDLTAELLWRREGKPRGFARNDTSVGRIAQDAALGNLIDVEQVAQLAPERSITATEAQITAAIAADLKQNPKLGIGGLVRAGLSEAQVRSYYRREVLASNLFARVRADVTPTPAQVLAYYRSHLDEFSTTGSRTIAVILVKSKAKADEILAKLRGGADFAKLADAESQDFGTKFDGGTTKAAAGATQTPVDRAGMALKTGATSVPTRTAEGWWIVRALDDGERARVRPFSEVKALAEGIATGNAPKLAERALWSIAHSRFLGKTVYAPGFEPLLGADRR